VLIGVMMSFLLAVPRAGRMLLTEFVLTEEGGVHERLPDDEPCGHILIFGLEGEMFFGATAALEQHFAAIEGRVTPSTQVLVLRVKRARSPDAVGLSLLDAFLERMKSRGVHVLLCGVRPEFARKMDTTGLTERLGERVFLEQPVRQTSTLLAIRHAYRILTSRCDRCPRRHGGLEDQKLYFQV
jgi:SulP family sulfate permease